MNLHAIVAGAIGAVNPFVNVLYRKSTGWAQDATYKRVPTYRDFPATPIQLQGLSAADLEHLDNLNIQGLMRSIHMNGDIQGVNRGQAQGGDLFVIGADTWLVVHVLETWPDWSRVAVAKQVPQ